MSITTCQKVTLISCSVLCVSLFLPKIFLSRGKSEIGQPIEVGPGFYPPTIRRLSAPEDPEQWGGRSPYIKVQSAEALAKVTGKGRAKKQNLFGQVIPIYGFGILLYILYIIYKLTCKPKGKKVKLEYSCSTFKRDHLGSKLANEYELIRLQEQLLETEREMEEIVSGKRSASGKSKSWRKKSKRSVSKKEEKLLKQLKHITQVIQEGRLEIGSPEMEAEEVPYTADWEGYDAETYPDHPEGARKDSGCATVILKVPEFPLPTAEALAERMEPEEEEILDRKLHIVHEEEEDEEQEEEEDEDDEEEEEEEEEEEVDLEIEDEEDKEDEQEEDEVEEAEKRLLLSSPILLRAGEEEEERLGMAVSEEIRRREPGAKHISFSDQRDVFRYPREDHNGKEKEKEAVAPEEMEDNEEEESEEEDEEEDEEEEEEEEEQEEGGEGHVPAEEETDEEDPVMEAESLLFSLEESVDPEAEAEEQSGDYLLEDPLGGAERLVPPDPAQGPGMAGLTGLRSRTRRPT